MENLWLNFIKTDTKNLMIPNQQNKVQRTEMETETQYNNPNDTR